MKKDSFDIISAGAFLFMLSYISILYSEANYMNPFRQVKFAKAYCLLCGL